MHPVMITKAPIANQYTTKALTDLQVLLIRQMRKDGYAKKDIIKLVECTDAQYYGVSKNGNYQDVHHKLTPSVGFKAEYEEIGFH